jgi:hypothetical protein
MAGTFTLHPKIGVNLVKTGIEDGHYEMFGPNGEHLFPGVLRVPRYEWEKDATGKPVRMFYFEGYVFVGQDKVSLDFKQPETEFNKLAEHLDKYLPEGTVYEKRDGLLRTAIIAATSNDPELMYTSVSRTWDDPKGNSIRVDGRKVLEAEAVPVILGERPGEDGTVYRIRCGEKFFDVSFLALQRGSWAGLMGEDARIYDPLKVFAILRERWTNLTDAQRNELALEEKRIEYRKEQEALRKRYEPKLGGAR